MPAYHKHRHHCFQALGEEHIERSTEDLASVGMLSLSKFSRRSSSFASPQSSCAKTLKVTSAGMHYDEGGDRKKSRTRVSMHTSTCARTAYVRRHARRQPNYIQAKTGLLGRIPVVIHFGPAIWCRHLPGAPIGTSLSQALN